MADLTGTHPLDERRSCAATAAAAAGDDAPFVSRYFRHVDVGQVQGRSADDLVAVARGHRDLAQHRPQGTSAVDVSGSLIHIVTDDRPFLVDSILGVMDQAGYAVDHLIHPQLLVRRDVAGDLQEVVDEDVTAGGHLGYGVAPESWMRVELPAALSDEDAADLAEAVRAALEDVRTATEDWSRMRAEALTLADELTSAHTIGPGDRAERREAADFLRWLADDHFTFLGSRDNDVREDQDGARLVPIAGSGLGVLRPDIAASELSVMSPGDVALVTSDHPLTVGKGRVRSRVHRATFPDHIAVRHRRSDGRLVERRFVGLFTSSAYTASVQSIPMVRDKVARILDDAGWAPDSHSGAHVLRILETFPRDELYQASTEHLERVLMQIMALEHKRRSALFLRADERGHYVTALVYIPRDRYTTTVRLKIEQVLRRGLDADETSFTAHVSEENLARLYFTLRPADGGQISAPDDALARDLSEQVANAARTWSENLHARADELVGAERAAALIAPFEGGFPADYQDNFGPVQAVADLKNLARLTDDHRTAGALYDPRRTTGTGDPRMRRYKLFSLDPVTLTDIMPVFRAMGVEVVDEEPYHLTRRDGRDAGVYDFGLRVSDAAIWQAHSHEKLRELVEGAVQAVWGGRAESDGFNALVIGCGMTWRQVRILRTIARYLRQIGATWSLDSLSRALVENPGLASDVVELFETRFDPHRHDGQAGEDRASAEQAVRDRIEAALDEVSSLEHDRIVRAFVAVIGATLRTNYYRVDDQGESRPWISMKIEPAKVPDMPKPWPAFEIWVQGPEVEGVHLRFGSVARGGLRWSDRRDDFRTEVLGLVKAQMVKNAVIVPTGSKGGFFAKQLPDPALDRDAWFEAGKAAYRSFISGLLDLTDNRIDGEVVPPADVVRHDGDDPYLVVAADKGTATFSDLANSVAREYSFWLDDAFASGGSIGYDHKGMGITARGAWESVKRHFRELGHDTQTEDFTVVGVGDMSGDVFGNGMLLSEHIRLVAAFDHRHVFVDPTPDAASSHAERQRLFDLPRSSWDDYDRSLISDGGGVWPRSAKSISITAPMREALGLPDNCRQLTPSELIHAILLAPVDLLWNGGIGTYIKGPQESHAEVGDRANDAIRVDGDQLRVRVVGEGGNLGSTQLGRIAAARAGVQINTDAVDNSAGVDTSDHEVNIKILLGEIVAAGDLNEPGRVELLASMTDEVGRQVLRDNYEQNVLLGNARAQGGGMLAVHERFMQRLEERGELDRDLEFLPRTAEVEERAADGLGLTSPELAVLLAYAKLAMKTDLLASDLPDDPATMPLLTGYFPEAIQHRYGDRLEAHPLRREIITTVVANDIVNRGGISFIFRAKEETGATSEQVARAYLVGRHIFGLREYVERIEALDNVVSTDVQTRLYLEFRRLLDRSVRWFLAARPGKLAIDAEIERFAPVVYRLAPLVSTLLKGDEAQRLQAKVDELVAEGVPTDLARWSGALLDMYSLLDIADIAADTGAEPEEVAAVYYTVSERFGIDDLLSRVTALPREEQWDALARAALRDDLYATLQSLTRSVLETADSLQDADGAFASWVEVHNESWERVSTPLAAIRALPTPTVAALSVALRSLRSVAR